MKKYIGEIGLVITAMIWGSGFVVSAISLEHFTPYQILAGRFLIGAVLLSLIFYKRFKRLKKHTLMKGVIIGIFLYVAFAFQTLGLQYTTPSKNAFLTAINVVIVPFIAFFIYKRKMNLYELLGAILAMVGVGVMSLKLSTEINIGDLLTLACAFAFAFQIFYTSKYVQEEDPILLTIIQLMSAAVMGVVVVLFKGETSLSLQAEGVFSLLYLGIFSTTMAYLLQTTAQKLVTATKTAIILSMESVWGMIFSILILNEMITFRMMIGAILIMLAILLSETKLPFFKKDQNKGNYIKVRSEER